MKEKVVEEALEIDVEGSRMHREAAESGAAVARFLSHNRQAIASLVERLRREPPKFVTTCARGSSDHAATYGKYLIETRLGIPVSSAALSVASIYSAGVARQEGNLCIAISQSGRSADLLATVKAHRDAGAVVVALVNDATSPLGGLADYALPLKAGPELSVAATKSYIASLAALAAIVAAWSQDARLTAAIEELPARLEQAFELGKVPSEPFAAGRSNMFVVGRGFSLAIAQEAALKLKETCGLHAEAFSSAEIRHGPMAIVGEQFPVLGFVTSDAAGDDVRSVAEEFSKRGAAVGLVKPVALGEGELRGKVPPELEPILMVQSFYRFVNRLSFERGFDPDEPPHLNKVTVTR